MLSTLVEDILPAHFYSTSLTGLRVEQGAACVCPLRSSSFFFFAHSRTQNFPPLPPAEVFDRLMENKMPTLWSHFQKLHVNTSMFICSWYLRIFMDVLPLQVGPRLSLALLPSCPLFPLFPPRASSSFFVVPSSFFGAGVCRLHRIPPCCVSPLFLVFPSSSFPLFRSHVPPFSVLFFLCALVSPTPPLCRPPCASGTASSMRGLRYCIVWRSASCTAKRRPSCPWTLPDPSCTT